MRKKFSSHGKGSFKKEDFARIGDNVIFEHGVLVFHPENIYFGSNIYIGHYTILKGYYKNKMVIGDNTWIGQSCFFHSGGGLKIGKNVGIGPGVKIITSYHIEEGTDIPILFSKIKFEDVVIEDDCDIGVGATILPGVKLGKGTQVGAGSVVVESTNSYSVVAGVPAKIIRSRRRDKSSFHRRGRSF